MITSVLYTTIIWPIEIVFEYIFSISNYFFKNIILSIVFLSIAVNTLTLPLYRRADKHQEEIKKKQNKMEDMIAHIKKTFKGDEQFMMLQTYYRENEYKPIYAIKGMLSLFLQIPFFIAAYRFLSNLSLLHGASFGPIKNLGDPDALVFCHGLSINILPILMTAINIFSSAIYTKGEKFKSKIQLYLIALVFLVLLYKSPAGLVLYWLCNNIFSLIKNIFEKIIKKENFWNNNEKNQKYNNFFWFGIVFLALFTGSYIPISIIKSSPSEFINIWNISNPMQYVMYSTLLAIGFFVVWIGLYYILSGNSSKRKMSECIFILCILAVFNYTFLGNKLDLLNSNLQYDTELIFYDSKLKILNLGVVIMLVIISGIVFRFINKKNSKLIKGLYITGILTEIFFIISGSNQINIEYKRTLELGKIANESDLEIPLSKNGKNVVLIMMDRAMGTEFPYIINEKPELIESFDGFTYYSNTISFGGGTVVAAPALFGGYEYTPNMINCRDEETIQEKIDESEKVLPVLFYENGYNVTISDPPFVDPSIYDEWPEMNVYITDGKYNSKAQDNYAQIEYLRKRNFFSNALMRVSPLILWSRIYDQGRYNTMMVNQSVEGISIAYGYRERFLDWYSTLDNLTNFCSITENDNTFLLMQNETTHQPMLLQEPDYTIENYVNNMEYDKDMESRYTLDGVTMRMENSFQVTHYHVNMVTMIKLAEWFDWMKENGVYDNTRIIIVSDHGFTLNQFDYLTEDACDMESFMPLLLMKDFNSTGFNVSDEFMTNADGVYFAVKDIIKDPLNMFTGNILDINEKYNQDLLCIYTTGANLDRNLMKYEKSKWFTIKEDIHEIKNWQYVGEW